jgi:hypothetical protein
MNNTNFDDKMIFLVIFLLCFSCSSENQADKSLASQTNQKGEYIYRKHDEYLFKIPQPEKRTLDPYPWEKGKVGNHTKITKEFFRCKGSSLNPVRMNSRGGEMERFFDCGGAEKHSLPLREGKEYIYPILIDILNYLQGQTGKRIVITSGHRCPIHNAYADPSKENQTSKHMIGAEVAFYIQGMEDKPETVIKYIQDYYKITPKYQEKKEYEEFQRYEKPDTNVSELPWYNKEIFIKWFKKKEGRDFDNRHPYPYISIQVRFDDELQEKVLYTWDKANHNYLRF